MCPEGYGQRALVVDDEADIRASLSALLTHEGYTVFEAGDGLEAVQQLQKRHFDVMISDYRMPWFDGLQLLAMCQLLWPQTAVVLVSDGDSSWIDLAIRRGAHAWVKKPCDRSELVAAVRQAVEEASARTLSHEARV